MINRNQPGLHAFAVSPVGRTLPLPLKSRAVTSSKLFADRVFSLSAIGKWGYQGWGEVVLIYLTRGIVRLRSAPPIP